MNMKLVRVGSRASPLARMQAENVLSILRPIYPNIKFEIVPIITSGDKQKDAPLISMERGVFVQEIESWLLKDKIDIAVHSAKDLTVTIPDGLSIVAVSKRQDPRDVQVNMFKTPLNKIPPGSRIGTSSPRRIAQLKALRPDLEIVNIRGNVGTRLDKVGTQEYDGVVLAAAGMLRMGRKLEIIEYFDHNRFTPEVGQGTLAAEYRTGDKQIAQILESAIHLPTSISLIAERAFLVTLGGGCNAPLGALATTMGNKLNITSMAALPDGSLVFGYLSMTPPDGSFV